MEEIVSQFLQTLKVPVSEKYVRKIIAAHPDFPSLLSISDTLKRLGVEHVAGRIRKETLSELPFPYLLPLEKGRGGDILLIKKKHDLVKHQDDLVQWGGVVLQAESTNETIDKTNNELFSKEKRVGHYVISLLLLFAILLLFQHIISFSWLALSLLMLSFAGIAVGYFILAKEVGVTYAVVDAFCNPNKTSTNSCDAILKSDIQLFGIKFSDAVLTYFVFQALILGLTQALPHATGFISALAWMSLITFPVQIFSLYYQRFVAKAWCRLCLVVVSILAIQFFVFAIGYINGSIPLIGNVPFVTVVVMAFLFAFIGLAVLLTKAKIEYANQLSEVGANGNRVKHSVQVFTQLLSQQRKVDTQPFQSDMRVGNPNAPIQIIMVSNLFCKPCKLKHSVVNQLIAMYPDKMSFIFRFVKSGREEDSLAHLLSHWEEKIHKEDNENGNTLSLLHDWFELWDFVKFKKKYPIQMTGASLQLASQHSSWIEKSEVRLTPTFFVNGHEMPKEYSIDDLLAMTPSLADSLEKNKINDSLLIIEN
jgi:protein-disulfide isomerase